MTEGQVLAVRVVVVGLGLPIVAWLFGSSILGRLTSLDRVERFAASFGVSLAFLGVAQFLGFLLKAPQPYYGAGVIAFMLALALLCRITDSTKKTVDRLTLWPLAVLFGLGYLHLFCIQALLPAYRGSYWYFDWWMHYDEALIFVHQRAIDTPWANGYTVASRTPLFNLTTAFAMGLTGGEFETYQMASVLPSCCFILGLFLLLRELFGPRASWLALLLAPLNLWMLHNAWFTWPKMLCAYYLVLALSFYLRSLRLRPEAPARGSEYFLAFGFSAVLAFLTHQVALVYCVPILLHAAAMSVSARYRPRAAELLGCLLFALLLAGPWYAWLGGNLGKDQILGSTPITKGDESAKFDPLDVAEWMCYNLRVSVDPVGIRAALYPHPDRVELHRGFTQLYFSLFTGALTISLTLFLIGFGLYRLFTGYRRLVKDIAESKPGRMSAWLAVFLFLGIGTLGGAFLHPGHIAWGIAHSAVFPSAVILAALGWGVLSLAPPRIRVLVVVGMAVEFLLMFWSHWWLLFHDPEILQPEVTGIRPDYGVRLLNESLGNAEIVFLVGAIAVQAILIGLLVLYAGRNRVVEEIG